MKRKVTVTLNRISFQENMDINSIQDVLSECLYDEEDGIGFTNIQTFEEVLEATLIKRTPTALQEFDPISGDFVQRNIFIFDEITFYIDLERGFIYTFSPMSKLNKVKSEFKNRIKGRVIYDNISLDPKKILNNFSEKGFDAIINEIVIKNFAYKKGAQGKFTARILDAKIGELLLVEYLDEVQKITAEITSDNFNDFVLTISMNNAFSIKSDKDDFFNILENLKNQIK